MALPIANRESGKDVFVPNNAAIAAAIEVATTPITANYLVRQFTAKMESLGKKMVEGSKTMLKTLEDHNRNMQMMDPRREIDAASGSAYQPLDELFKSKDNAWAGVIPDSNLNNFHAARAEIASEKLVSENINEIEIDFALSESSQLVRAFTLNDNPLDLDAQVSLDELMSGFFTKNNLYAEVTDTGTFLYEGDGKGLQRTDNNGRPIKADPEVVGKLLSDQDRGFQSYMQAHGLNSTIKRHPFPGEAPEAKPTPEVPEVAKPASPEEPPSQEMPTPS